VIEAKRSSQAPAALQWPVIELQNATVWIDAKRVLHGLSWVVRRGECWVLHGANGSGKSTLLRTVYGDHAVASGGSIRRAGVVSGVPLDHFRARTGLIAPHLQTDYPRHHSVIETVVSGLHSSIGLNFRPTAAELKRARSALRQFDLLPMAERALHELSYGQMRRVLFARAAVAWNHARLRPRMVWAKAYSATGRALASAAVTMRTPRRHEAWVTRPRTLPAPSARTTPFHTKRHHPWLPVA
jgi:ABC-type molybdenum transport system ATPase subunit/photorepair protein PhrA